MWLKGEEKTKSTKEAETKGVGCLASKKNLACGLKHNTYLLFGTRPFIKFDSLIQFWNMSEYYSIKAWNVKGLQSL